MKMIINPKSRVSRSTTSLTRVEAYILNLLFLSNIKWFCISVAFSFFIPDARKGQSRQIVSLFWTDEVKA